jgi:hypothetical protein
MQSHLAAARAAAGAVFTGVLAARCAGQKETTVRSI